MPSRTQHFYSLDVLRGIAALTVVFWHWKHFAYVGVNAIADPTAQPLYPFFDLFYGAGWMAVELFFSLSGFIFFWLYAKSIADRRVSAWEFVVLRFSRLYPLHLATLLAITAEQLLFRRMTGHDFIYSAISRREFVWNLGLVSAWGLDRPFTYNAPIWSVSVEVALYAVFFVFCRTLRVRPVSVLALAAIGFVATIARYSAMTKGLAGFFIGGLVYLGYEWIVRGGYTRRLAWSLPPVTTALWIVTALRARAQLKLLGGGPWRPDHILDYWQPIVVLFPLTILTLAIVETHRGTLGRRVSFIGHLSYSSYLIHFPLQVAVAGIVTRFAIDQAIFTSPWFLLAFFGLLVALSLASYYAFELPAQRWLRGRLLQRRPLEAAPMRAG